MWRRRRRGGGGGKGRGQFMRALLEHTWLLTCPAGTGFCWLCGVISGKSAFNKPQPKAAGAWSNTSIMSFACSLGSFTPHPSLPPLSAMWSSMLDIIKADLPAIWVRGTLFPKRNGKAKQKRHSRWLYEMTEDNSTALFKVYTFSWWQCTLGGSQCFLFAVYLAVMKRHYIMIGMEYPPTYNSLWPYYPLGPLNNLCDGPLLDVVIVPWWGGGCMLIKWNSPMFHHWSKRAQELSN